MENDKGKFNYNLIIFTATFVNSLTIIIFYFDQIPVRQAIFKDYTEYEYGTRISEPAEDNQPKRQEFPGNASVGDICRRGWKVSLSQY